MLVWQAHNTRVRALAFAPDGPLLASVADGAKTVRLWNPATGERVGEFADRWQTWGVVFGPDGRLAATTSEVYRVVVWDRAAWEPLAELYYPETRCCPRFTPDGAAVAATGPSGVAVWADPGRPAPKSVGARTPKNCRKPTRVFRSASAGHTFHSLAFSPDGRLVAASGEARAVVWDVATRKTVRKFDHRPTPVPTVLAFSPDGGRVAVGHGKQVDVWPVGDGPAVTLRGHQLFVRGVGFTPDGRSVTTAGSDGTVRLWDSGSGAEARSFDWGIGRVYCAAFSPDGLTGAAGGEKGKVVVWDVDA